MLEQAQRPAAAPAASDAGRRAGLPRPTGPSVVAARPVHHRDVLARKLAVAVQERATPPAAMLQREIQYEEKTVDGANWPTYGGSGGSLVRAISEHCGTLGSWADFGRILQQIERWAREPRPARSFLTAEQVVSAAHSAVLAAGKQARPVAAQRPQPETLESGRDAGRYELTVTTPAKIRYRSAEKDFAEDYSDGTSVEDAVNEAIDTWASGSQSTPRLTRFDFQPARAGVVNLQVQLGGSKGDFHRGQGDSSATLVVVDEALWTKLETEDRDYLVRLVVLAHRRSFRDAAKVELKSPVVPTKPGAAGRGGKRK